MEQKIIDRYLAIKARMEGTDNENERTACSARMETMRVEYPGIEVRAAAVSLEERLRSRLHPDDTPDQKARRGKPAGERPLEGFVASMLGVLNMAPDDVPVLDRFLSYLADHEELGRAVLGDPGEVEPDPDALDALEQRVKFHRIEKSRKRKARGEPRRVSLRVDFEVPWSVWQKHVANTDGDAYEISPEGAMAFVDIMMDALLLEMDED